MPKKYRDDLSGRDAIKPVILPPEWRYYEDGSQDPYGTISPEQLGEQESKDRLKQLGDLTHDAYSLGRALDDLEHLKFGKARKELDELKQRRADREAGIDDQVGEGYSPEDKPKGIIRQLVGLSVKKALLSYAVVLGIAAIIALSLIITGHMQFKHFAKVLDRFHFVNDTILVNGRASNMYRLWRLNPDPNLRNLGYFGNIGAEYYDNELKKAGIEPDRAHSRGIGFKINSKTTQGQTALIRIEQDMKRQLEKDRLRIISTPGSDIVTVDMTGGSAHVRRNVNSIVMSALGPDVRYAAVGRRLLNIRGGVPLHPIENIVRRADEKYAEWRDNVRKKKVANRSGGTRVVNPLGVKGADPNDPQGAAANQGAQQTAAEAQGLQEVATDPGGGSLKARVEAFRMQMSRGSGPISFIAITCALQQIGDAAYDLQHDNATKPMIRIGVEMMAVGSQVASGQDFNEEILAILSEDFYDEETQTGWNEARSIQAEFGQELTGPDLPDSAKPGDIRLPIISRIDDIIKGLGLEPVCKAATNQAAGFALDAAGWLSHAGGPFSLGAKVITDLAAGFVIGPFIEDLVKWLAGEQIPRELAGAALGNVANYGTLMAANDTAISKGAIVLTQAEIDQLDAQSASLLQREFQQKSFFARYFDLNEPQSLAAKTMFETPALNSPEATVASFIRMPATLLGNVSKILPFSGKVSAQATYDYGIPEYGFTLAEQDDPRYEDPYANAEKVEPNLAALNKEYGKECFGMTINPSTYTLESEKDIQRYKKIPDKCKNRNNQELTAYRFYLLDMTVAKSMACYDGLDEASCTELGFGKGNTGGTSTAGPLAGSGELTGPCAPGTTDLGVPTDPAQSAYKAGQPVQARLCAMPGFKSTSSESQPGTQFYIEGANGNAIVSSVASYKFWPMIQAAQAAGVPLTSRSSFRTMPHQTSLYNAPHSAPVAKPGYSNHQGGEAIDFGCNGGGVTNGNCFSWLKQNAGGFGIKNLPSEAWHWSLTGG